MQAKPVTATCTPLKSGPQPQEEELDDLQAIKITMWEQSDGGLGDLGSRSKHYFTIATLAG